MLAGEKDSGSWRDLLTYYRVWNVVLIGTCQVFAGHSGTALTLMEVMDIRKSARCGRGELQGKASAPGSSRRGPVSINHQLSLAHNTISDKTACRHTSGSNSRDVEASDRGLSDCGDLD
ncbi:hypothetical protein DPEC_G00349970 [Dallia pectoralis]|uniref:Uncharacterized protein n=1 Tax=Dallia pectoralis TaxID=75939 RepID=A0ACC2F1K8_DALPE|nr:hypothetical protein DPEC_G00349970 [Dallia pectoralis]